MGLLLRFDPESQLSVGAGLKLSYLDVFKEDNWEAGRRLAAQLRKHPEFGSIVDNLARVKEFIKALKENKSTSMPRAIINPLRKLQNEDDGERAIAKHHQDPYLDGYSVQAVRAYDAEEIESLDLEAFWEDLKLLSGPYRRPEVWNPLLREGDVNDLIAVHIMQTCSQAISTMLENWWDRYEHARPTRFTHGECPYVMPRAQHSQKRKIGDKAELKTSVVDHTFVFGDDPEEVLVFVEDKRARAVYTTDIAPFTRPIGYKKLIDKALNPKGELTDKSPEGIAVFGQLISAIGSHSENMQSHMRQAVEYNHVFRTDYGMLTDGLTGIPMILRDNAVRNKGIIGDVARQFLFWDVGEEPHADSAGISVLYLLWRRLRDEGCFHRDFAHEPVRRAGVSGSRTSEDSLGEE